MLFVQHDDAHVLDGHKDRRARADRDTGAALPKALPFVEALPRREPAVHDGGKAPEARAQLGEHLRRQGNFRHQKDRRLSARQRAGDEGEIDFRLAAARHAVQ